MDATKGDHQDPKQMLLWNNFYNFGKDADITAKYAPLRRELELCTDIDEIDLIFNRYNFPTNIRYRTAFLYGLMGVTQVYS